MSRTIKTGLDYFPLDTNLDEKFEMIEAEHGLIGFAIIIKLYQEIYKNGYYCLFDKKRKLLFCKRNNVDINNLNVIIKSALEWNIFTKKIYNDYNILTSAGIQKQFLKITERRKEVTINEKIWLINNNGINDNIIIIDDNIIPINTNIGTQSKGKGESKVKLKIKGKGKGKEYSGFFTEFWSAYPKKTGKGAAYKSWEKIDPSIELIKKIMFAVKEQSISEQWLKSNGQYIPNPATWLNQERWEDELILPTGLSDVSIHNRAVIESWLKKKEQENEN